MSRHAVSRRAVLGASGALAAAACQGEEAPRPPPQPNPDERLRREVAADVRRLLAGYAATVERHPGSAAQLAPLMSEHGVHLQALDPRAASSAAPPSATPSSPTQTAPTASTPAASGRPTDPAVPDTPAAARELLARGERTAAQRRVQQLVAASPKLARLIAAIGASEAAHAVLLSRSP